MNKDKFKMSSNCNVLDLIYVEGPENWIGSVPTLVQTYYKSAIALCEYTQVIEAIKFNERE